MGSHHERHWGPHPAVPTGTDLTLGERAADVLRSGMGSWGFIFGFLGAMAAWMLGNGEHGIDPFPFILLNLALSTLAGLQGGILLISAKRQDAINAALAQHDRDTMAALVAINAQQTQLLEALHEHLGIKKEGTQ